MDAVDSCLALCWVLALLMQIQTAKDVSPNALHTAIIDHLTAHQKAYGELLWKPKHHYVTHLADSLAHHGVLLACFLMERKHKVLKRMADTRHCTRDFDRALIEQATMHHLDDLQHPMVCPGLMGPHAPSKKLVAAVQRIFHSTPSEEILTASKMKIRGRAVCKGDVVSFRTDAGDMAIGEIYFHAQVKGQCWSCISQWETVQQAVGATRCRVRELPLFLSSDLIGEPVVFAPAEESKIATALWPARRLA